MCQPLRVLMVASEVVGFAKTGGLADVCGSLPRALARRGLRGAVIMPLYHAARNVTPAPVPTDLVLRVPLGDGAVAARLWRSQLPGSDVPVFLVEQNDFFDRDTGPGRGLYQEDRPDGSRSDYHDNCARFAFFNRAVLEALPVLDFWPDVLHVNDWQTGLVPVYLREVYARHDHRYARTRSLLTIHNIAFQGCFPPDAMPLLGLGWPLYNPAQLEFYGHVSFLKAGVVFADLLNTVSPTYAREIQTPYYGRGMQGILSENRHRLYGIVNGVDYDVWSPDVDPHLAARYGPDDLSGKAACKAALQREMGLEVRPDAPLLGVVARLTDQKGVDLIASIAPGLFAQGAQLAVLGAGDRHFEDWFHHLHAHHPGHLGLKVGFSEPLAHRIEAGSDLFLMPSAFEPSGLNQLYSLRYGTPPVVRATGGLADTVTDTNPETLHAGTATGFSFKAHSAHGLWEAVERAVHLWREHPDAWRQVMRAGMRQDWSWDRSAAEYERLYRLMSAPRALLSEQVRW